MKRNVRELPSRGRTNSENGQKKVRAIVCAAVALGTFFGGLLSAAEAQPVPAGAVACYFVGRVLLNSNGQGEAVGYFTDVTGIPGPLFKDAPDESTAIFTFRSDVNWLRYPPTATLDSLWFPPEPSISTSTPRRSASGAIQTLFRAAS